MTCGKRQRADSGWPAVVFWGFLALGLLSPGFASETTDPAEPGPLEQTLATIQDCMAHSPAPWPEAWRQEYVQTIRKVVASRQKTTDYDKRLAALRDGFEPYWEGLKKTQERSLFEVHCAEIRWYVESLMDANLPEEQERRALRNQYAEVFHYAASTLLTQFAFLDPNAVQKAEADHLAQCYHKIEAALLPIYRCLFSQAQMEQIKGRWHDLRYARVDLWRQLGGDASTSAGDPHAGPIHTHPHYVLAQRSLAQLQGQLWAIVARAPDYYSRAVANHIEGQKRRLQSRSWARAQERRLQEEHSGQFFQTEQIAFMLAALLESARCFDESSSGQVRSVPRGQGAGGTGGGDTHGRE